MNRTSKVPMDIIVEENAYLNGTINTPNSVKISGAFKGKIFSTKTVYIETTGRIDGDIQAETIVISGSVKGNVVADERVHLTSTSKLSGDIVAQNFTIDRGAFFQGKCVKGNREKVS